MADDDTQSRFATLEAEGRHTRQVVTDMSADLRSLLALVTEIRLSQATMLSILVLLKSQMVLSYPLFHPFDKLDNK